MLSQKPLKQPNISNFYSSVLPLNILVYTVMDQRIPLKSHFWFYNTKLVYADTSVTETINLLKTIRIRIRIIIFKNEASNWRTEHLNILITPVSDHIHSEFYLWARSQPVDDSAKTKPNFDLSSSNSRFWTWAKIGCTSVQKVFRVLDSQ